MKDVPLAVLLPAAIVTFVYMWWQNLFALAVDSVLVFLVSAGVAALTRWAIQRRGR